LALGYIRVSTKKQDKGFSPEAQQKEVSAYVRQHGWEHGKTFRDTLQGMRDDRPGYREMLEQVRFLRKQGRHVVMVAAALDRTGRDLAELFAMRKALRQLGVQLHYTRDGGALDDDSAMLKGWQASKETEKLSTRVSASKKMIAELGLPPSGPAPWGYRWRLPQTPEEEAASFSKKQIRRVLDVQPTEARYVRDLFARAAGGATIGQLCRWVATLSSEARGGRVLGRSNVARLLRNPVYVGRYTRDGDDSPEAILAQPAGRWLVLLEDEVWRVVQTRLSSHQSHPRQASGRFLLTGFIWCPECGCRMAAHTNGRSGRGRTEQAHRYRCVSSVSGKAERDCFFGATMAMVDQSVVDQVAAVLDANTDPDLEADIRQAWDELRTPTNPTEQRAKQLDGEITKLRTRIRKAREDLYDEVIGQAEHDAMVGPWRAALAESERQRSTLQSEPAEVTMTFSEAMAAAQGWRERLQNAPTAAQREVLAELVKRVEPVRLSYGKYRAHIAEWTGYGDTLRKLASRAAEIRAERQPVKLGIRRTAKGKRRA
jgi:DNA invertase Pin-like site-specific DNA recombinase